jgi:hypothetical protein
LEVKTVYINRGLPGSGKTTRTARMGREFQAEGLSVVVCSADDFHMCHCCGKYDFRFDRLPYAHEWCQGKYRKALRDGIDRVFVDNTNTTVRECYPYVQMALVYGYDIVFLEPDTPWAFDLDELERKNVHGVPRAALEKMLARWVPDMTVEKVRKLSPDSGG